MKISSPLTTKVAALPLDSIRPGNNDRHVFKEAALQHLADSIKTDGLLQPITVRKRTQDGTDYELITGERRYRACQLLGWATIPAMVIRAGDERAAALMLTENTNRADLDPIDEGRAYQERIEKYGWTVDECAKRAGVIPWQVKSRIGLLTLLPDIQQLVRTGQMGLRYAQLMDEYHLDPAHQQQALLTYRNRPVPTAAWFKDVVEELANHQAQGELGFTTPLFMGLEPADAQVLPKASEIPDPLRAPPLLGGDDLHGQVSEQRAYWEIAAAQWDMIGKTGKAAQCLAVVAVLTGLLERSVAA